MIKKNKIQLIISSVATLAPIVMGLILWNDLPQQIATHWGMNGEPDGYSSKAFIEFVQEVVSLRIQSS